MLFYFLLSALAGVCIGLIFKKSAIWLLIPIVAATVCGFVFKLHWVVISFVGLCVGILIARCTSSSFAKNISAQIRDTEAKALKYEKNVIAIPVGTVGKKNAIPEKIIDSSKDDFIVTDEIARFLELINKTDNNIFITGKAGTGKSTLLKWLRKNLRKNIITLAPTGIAALNIGGQTIHSFFHFPFTVIQPNDPSIKYDLRRHDLFRKIDVIIVDEISMVRADLLDAMDKYLQLNRGNTRPFGGARMILFGDPFQLPPVVKGKDLNDYFNINYGSPYFFDAKSYATGGFKYLELTKVFRQKDQHFIEILNGMRENRLSVAQLGELNKKFNPAEDESHEHAITLCATNKIATEINEGRLSRLNSTQFSYPATIIGNFKESDYPTDSDLCLKAGTQVMMLKNDPDKKWVNGTLGVIEKLEDDNIEVNIDGFSYPVTRAKWDTIEYQYNRETNKIEAKITGQFIQYPLKPAWAITIHKSQGQTFERININLGNGAFTHGQTYVALSRCTTLSGIALKTRINREDIIVDPKVKNFLLKMEAKNAGYGVKSLEELYD